MAVWRGKHHLFRFGAPITIHGRFAQTATDRARRIHIQSPAALQMISGLAELINGYDG